MKTRLRAALATACLWLAACTVQSPALPALRVPPQALAQPIAVQQRLTVEGGGRSLQLQLALEADPEGVRLAVLDLGHTVARLSWDGGEPRTESVPGWPDAVSAKRMLTLLQLVHWPVVALQAALPAGWALDEDSAGRVLRHEGRAAVVVRYPAPDRVEIDDRVGSYRVVIESRHAGAAP